MAFFRIIDYSIETGNWILFVFVLVSTFIITLDITEDFEPQTFKDWLVIAGASAFSLFLSAKVFVLFLAL